MQSQEVDSFGRIIPPRNPQFERKRSPPRRNDYENKPDNRGFVGNRGQRNFDANPRRTQDDNWNNRPERRDHADWNPRGGFDRPGGRGPGPRFDGGPRPGGRGGEIVCLSSVNSGFVLRKISIRIFA